MYFNLLIIILFYFNLYSISKDRSSPFNDSKYLFELYSKTTTQPKDSKLKVVKQNQNKVGKKSIESLSIYINLVKN